MPRYDSFIVSTRPFRCSRSAQANEVVAAEVRNHIIWTNDEVRQPPPPLPVGSGSLMVFDRTSARSSVL